MNEQAGVGRSVLLAALSFLVLMGIIYLGVMLRSVDERLEYLPPVGDPAVVLEDAGTGHQVYVPVYSHIYAAKSEPYLLTATVSVRNTDPENSITVTGVRYYDGDGKRVGSFLDAPLEIGPLGSREFVVDELDRSGGVGANFLIEWAADERVHPPIIESVMIGRGISFVSRGVKLERKGD